MNKSITINDLAQLASVSRSTVSRVISGNPHVSAESMKKVNHAIATLGYAPNEVARSLVRGYQNHLYLIITDIRNPFFAELARGVEEVGFAHGCPVSILNTDDDIQRELFYLTLVERNPGTGLIIVPSEEESSLLNHLSKIPGPSVLLSRYLQSNDERPAVYFDNRLGATMAVEYLIKLGHTRIAYLEGLHNSIACRDRTQGFVAAMEGHSLPLNQSLWGQGHLRIEDGYHFVQQLLLNHCAFTSLFCSSDLMAIGALHALEEMGRRVPEDVSVIGFDDVWLSSLKGIELTTIKQPAFEMGKKAAELVFNKESLDNRHYVFPPSLVTRKTTIRLKSEIPT